ncbi:hypothetical protein G7046_g9117 [Stylonectria norvegica]|nr:hypothetical protein G7046_g9117 [Stylonectria norvegica]
MPPKRMTANPLKAPRHRPGKEPTAESSSDSDASDADDEPEAPALPPPPKATSAGKISSNLGKVDLNARRKEAEAAETRRVAKENAERLAVEEGFVTEDEDEDEDAAEQGEEDGSDDEETSEALKTPKKKRKPPA